MARITPPASASPSGASGVGIKGTKTVAGTGSGNYTTTSTTWADIDATNLTITTTGAVTGDVLRIELMCTIAGTVTSDACLDLVIAGTRQGDTLGLLFGGAVSAQNLPAFLSYDYVMTSDTQVTIKPQFKSETSGQNTTVWNNTSQSKPRFRVTNLGPLPLV